MMLSPPASRLRAAVHAAFRGVPGRGREAAARAGQLIGQQFITRNRRVGFGLSLAVILIAIFAVQISVRWFSPGLMILPILGGGLLMWPRALRVLFAIAAGGLAYDAFENKAGPGIIATIVVTAIYADVLANTRGKLGTRGRRADRMMIELRDRIRAQGTLPELGEGWGSTVILRPAGGSSFGGDFVVSHSDGKSLEVALVDVSGKGMDAATRALLLSGAFGGVLGTVSREQFLPACNAYLRRSQADEGFVTAVHLYVDLATGEYVLSSAGHPPAVRFDANTGRWEVSPARGIVLGVMPDMSVVPASPEVGTLRRGDAIALYTDGLVEAPGKDIDEGIGRLVGEADRMVVDGFRRGAPALVTAMQEAVRSGDDCAFVLIWRT